MLLQKAHRSALKDPETFVRKARGRAEFSAHAARSPTGVPRANRRRIRLRRQRRHTVWFIALHFGGHDSNASRLSTVASVLTPLRILRFCAGRWIGHRYLGRRNRRCVAGRHGRSVCRHAGADNHDRDGRQISLRRRSCRPRLAARHLLMGYQLGRRVPAVAGSWPEV